MSQLELIWELENHYNLLDNHLEDLETSLKNLKMKSLTQEYYKQKEKIDNINEKIKTNRRRISENNRFINTWDYRIKEIDTNLYDGKITDFKQINYLISEKDRLKNQVEDVETEILILMEESDYLEKQYTNLLGKLSEAKKEIKALKKSREHTQEDLKDKIKYERNEIQKCQERIDKTLLDRYETLKKNKKSGIVNVRNYVCSGCNMMVSSSLKEKIQLKKEIVFCEYCGRILYFTEV